MKCHAQKPSLAATENERGQIKKCSGQDLLAVKYDDFPPLQGDEKPAGAIPCVGYGDRILETRCHSLQDERTRLLLSESRDAGHCHKGQRETDKPVFRDTFHGTSLKMKRGCLPKV